MEEKLYLSDPNFKPQFIKINIRTPEERQELALKVRNAINGFYQSFSIFIESAKLPQVSITADNIFELNPDKIIHRSQLTNFLKTTKHQISQELKPSSKIYNANSIIMVYYKLNFRLTHGIKLLQIP